MALLQYNKTEVDYKISLSNKLYVLLSNQLLNSHNILLLMYALNVIYVPPLRKNRNGLQIKISWI